MSSAKASTACRCIAGSTTGLAARTYAVMKCASRAQLLRDPLIVAKVSEWEKKALLDRVAVLQGRVGVLEAQMANFQYALPHLMTGAANCAASAGGTRKRKVP